MLPWFELRRINEAAVSERRQHGLVKAAPPKGERRAAHSADPRFRTFTSIVHRSGLEPSARGTQPFTVFMPTEAAFDRYPELRASLLGPASEAFPDTHALVMFVRAHVLLGLHPTPPLGERSERVMTRVGTTIDIINTTPPTISWQSSGGRIGTATLSEAPIIASNALIYPIDNPSLLVSSPDPQ